MSFEQRLGELLNDEGPDTAGLRPGPIIAGARRRRARRTVGIVAAATAVVAVAGVTAVTMGDAQRGGGATAAVALTSSAAPAAGLGPAAAPASATAKPSATTPAGLPLSPVKQVAPGEKIEFADGARMWVTANEKCDEYRDSGGGWGNGSGCRDVRSDNLEHDKPSLYAQGSYGPKQNLVASFYLGPTPARIVGFQDGKPFLATLVTTPGMTGWTGYYLVMPGLPAPTGNNPPANPAIAAYDAQGKLLAALPGRHADGSRENAPATL
ncbi:hypothetical protein [Kitasatospora sp. NPDC097643]|uniref:hypothetical protein n=1 Tax=Kitasatospora sp. NPDC097643 TaxID=3157230 RepID=UPI003328EBA6